MCLFKKKKKKPAINNNKYSLGQYVKFRYRGELDPGVIYDLDLDSDGNVIYDVQVGGECPFIVRGVKEKDIIPNNRY